MIVARNGRFGPYVTEVLGEDAPKSAKPRTGSLFAVDEHRVASPWSRRCS